MRTPPDGPQRSAVMARLSAAPHLHLATGVSRALRVSQQVVCISDYSPGRRHSGGMWPEQFGKPQDQL